MGNKKPKHAWLDDSGHSYCGADATNFRCGMCGHGITMRRRYDHIASKYHFPAFPMYCEICGDKKVQVVLEPDTQDRLNEKPILYNWKGDAATDTWDWHFWKEGDVIVYKSDDFLNIFNISGFVKEVHNDHIIIATNDMNLWVDDDNCCRFKKVLA